MKNFLITLTILSTVLAIEKTVDYSKEPYTALTAFFGPGGVETPDACGDNLKHVTVTHDNTLNRNVFVYSLHNHAGFSDSDRCEKYDRQRVETSVTSRSDTWMHGKNGMTFTHAWKFYSQKDIKLSGFFCHIHQIKLDGAGVGNPAMTVTMRKDKVVLDNEGKQLSTCPIADFVGHWIQFRSKITFGTNGCLTFSGTRMSDGKKLLSYTGCGVKVSDEGGMIRPKFGFYRSLEDKSTIRDESVRLVDICIGQGDSCHFNQFGERANHKLQAQE